MCLVSLPTCDSTAGMLNQVGCLLKGRPGLGPTPANWMPAGNKLAVCSPKARISVTHLTVLNGISSGNEITDVRHLGEPQNTLEALGLRSSHMVGKENWLVSQEIGA